MRRALLFLMALVIAISAAACGEESPPVGGVAPEEIEYVEEEILIVEEWEYVEESVFIEE